MAKEIIRSIKSYFEMERSCGVSEYLFSEKSVEEKLSLLRNEALSCRKCPLARTRHKVVFGEGNINAALMFIGEAPGHDEDVKGMPFVGEAGMLLTKIIESIGLKREDAYICNILKCRPPQNRNPLPEEIAQCAGYLAGQIDLIKPRIICGLGKVASQAILNTEEPITKLRGSWREARGIKFMPTFHPAYLLRNPSAKKLVWQDVKKIKGEL